MSHEPLACIAILKPVGHALTNQTIRLYTLATSKKQL